MDRNTFKKENSQIITNIDQNIPYIIGQFTPATRINTQIVNVVQKVFRLPNYL